MENQNPIITVTHDLRPAYYDDFACLGGACRNSCCRDWNIEFNKKDYLALKNLKSSPELTDRMEHSIQRIRDKEKLKQDLYAKIHLKENGDCPMHREDGLCALQLEHGEKVLPEVCRTYPRMEKFLWEKECALSPSCEAVLALLWNLPQGVDFRSDSVPINREMELFYEHPLFLAFPEIRSLCIDILQQRALPVKQRILFLGMRLQKLRDDMTEAEVQQWCRQTEILLQEPDLKPLLQEMTPPLEGQTLQLYLLDCLTKIREVQGTIGEQEKKIAIEIFSNNRLVVEGETIKFSTEAFQTGCTAFAEMAADWELFYENLAVSVFWWNSFPFLFSTAECWASYVSFCELMGLYVFLAIDGCTAGWESNKERLFDRVVFASRKFLHNSVHAKASQENMKQNHSDSLAHMAILLGP